MKKLLSYCLFSPKVLPSHRDHDRWRNFSDRYWYNIVATTLSNQVLYPDYEMRLYLTPNVWENPLSEIIKILQSLPNFKVETIDRDYKLTEPAVWRMIPLWELDVQVFHTRDIDSVPTEIEYRYVRAFEKSNCSVGTLRTHANHYGIKCRMLAGLSSFKPQRVPYFIKLPNFNTYYSFRHDNYGSDQDLMIELFTSNQDFTKVNFLDYCDYHQKNKQDFPCCSLGRDAIMKIQLSNEQQGLFNFMKENSLDNWAGEPVDVRGHCTNYMLENFSFLDIKNQILENQCLKEFYGVE